MTRMRNCIPVKTNHLPCMVLMNLNLALRKRKRKEIIPFMDDLSEVTPTKVGGYTAEIEYCEKNYHLN